MPIEIGPLIPHIRQLAAQAARNEGHRTEQAARLRRVFDPAFDVAAWAETCAAAARVDGWSGASFDLGEPANQQFGFAAEPQTYALISVDGSQIYPDRHKPFQYYFIQAGAACIAYGLEDGPQAEAVRDLINTKNKRRTELVYDDAKLLGKDNRLISPGEVGNKRDLLEIELLAERCEQFAALGLQAIALADGSIVPFALLNEMFLSRSRKEARELHDKLVDALNRLRKCKAIVAGYIDRPDSNGVVKACQLAALSPAAADKRALHEADVNSQGLFDRRLLAEVVQPGRRTALFNPNWEVNSNDWLGRGNHAMHACYVNFGESLNQQAIVGRIELPAWCAPQLGVVAGLLQRQTRVGNGYPFILKAAHEEAVITKEDQRELEALIQAELRDHGLRTATSPKQESKDSR